MFLTLCVYIFNETAMPENDTICVTLNKLFNFFESCYSVFYGFHSTPNLRL